MSSARRDVFFEVPGEPVGKGRHRMTRSGHVYTPKATSDYEEHVRVCFLKESGETYFEKGVPVKLRIFAYYKIPKSASKQTKQDMLKGIIRPTKKPDVDNIAKIIMDAIGHGLAYYDDAQVVSCTIEAWYSEKPCVEVSIGLA